ncbi:MAG: extracellular solute-binding protein, partial [Proteobacteria bacterium]|nr:extracellular solute-binding protein [Pseudomonadota bacterium]
PAVLGARRAAAAGSVMFAGAGGITQRLQTKVFLEPFTAKSGVSASQRIYADADRLGDWITSAPAGCDLVSLSGPLAMMFEGKGLLAPIPDGVIDVKDLVHAPWRSKAAVAWQYQSAGIGFSPKRHPPGKHPRTWAQFFDGAGFPGRRGLRVRAEENLEIALLADGVAAKDLYPLDVDRAFRAIQRLRPAIAAWIKNPTQDVGLIRTDMLDFNIVYSAQVLEATVEGAAVGFAIDEPLSVPEFLAVPKSSRNKDNAFKLMAAWLAPANQTRWALEAPGRAPHNVKAFESLPAEVRERLHQPSTQKGVFIDVAWWAKNGNAAEARFRKWMQT